MVLSMTSLCCMQVDTESKLALYMFDPPALPLAELARSEKATSASLRPSRGPEFCDKRHISAKMMSSEQILERAAQDGHIDVFVSSSLQAVWRS